MSDTVAAPHEIVERCLELSTTDGCVVLLEEGSQANLRWAGNALTTNAVTGSRTLTVVSTVDGARGTAAGVVTRGAVTAADLEPVVRAAEAAARAAAPADDAQPLVPGGAGDGFTEPPAETSAEVFREFAPALGAAFRAARTDGGRELYGFAQHVMTSTYLGTSTGLRRRHDQPTGTLEVNAKSPDRTRSAWAGLPTRDFLDVDIAAVDADLGRRLAWAERRIELPAGRYPALLPPSAVADLMVWTRWFAGARDSVEGRTVFSRPGGGTRIGERLAELPLTLRSDPAEPGLETAPFVIAHRSGNDSSVFDNGLTVVATDWIRGGTLTALTASRYSAGLAGLPPTPAIDNLILEGNGGPELDAMIAATERGLLLTCLWYIREVDPATMLLTGLTRDGVYLVEHGEVVGAVNNYRFNESPVDLLSRATEAGSTERTLGRESGDWMPRVAMPPLRVPDFNMSTVSPGV
jgi:predicted Zn-dependent protease